MISSLFKSCELKPYGDYMRLIYLGDRYFCLIPWILKFEVELLSHVRDQYFEVAFGECFAETDSLSSVEGNPAHSMSLFARWSQVKWALWVESLRKKLRWALPFG